MMGDNLKPSDIFDDDQLHKWAIMNGYTPGFDEDYA